MTLPRIFNTLTRSVEPFEPIEPGHVRMYVCGMTIYDYCHLGHARMMLTFDIVQRWLKACGLRVTYVRNITDIDDKIIKRAVERGITMKALTTEMAQAMHEDIAALGIEPPTQEPRATDYIPQMLTMIGQLEARGLAYRTAQHDVNFAVRRFPNYGQLSGKSIDQLRAGERVALNTDKDDPLDFVLWKAAKADEPAEAKYDSPYGYGRPGWHIECSAMSCTLLGEHFDIHGGGLDLQFPHHENEIAQSVGATGQPFVNVWMHNGFVNIDNEKMSKSLGNFFTIRDILQKYDGESLRFAMMRVHYRSPFNHSDVGLEDARQGLRRLYTALASVPPTQRSPSAFDFLSAHADNPYVERFVAAMHEDFNTALAVSVLFDLASDINRTQNPQSSNLLLGLGQTLGLLQQDPQQYLQGAAGQSSQGLDPQTIEAKIAQRAAAKAAKDFKTADAIRQELAAAGIELKDTPQGTHWVRA